MLKVLLVSPLWFPVNSETRYAGIEHLVWEYARALSKRCDVSVLGHKDSVFPPEVCLLECEGYPTYLIPETQAFQAWQFLFREFDVIHDFSHLHIASRNMKLPSLNQVWHSPQLMQAPKAPYNIIMPSEWGVKQFRHYYNQDARYMQTIAIDTTLYKPKGKHGDRFLTLGRMAPEKGNLKTVLLCKKRGVPLDVCGSRGAGVSYNEPLSEYEQAIMDNCDGKIIKFHGEVTDEEKIELMQSCRALIYCTDHPEPTNHKLQEAMLCGSPVIAPNIGAQPEIVTHGVDGFLCFEEQEYLDAIDKVDILKPWKTYNQMKHKYSVKTVTNGFLKLYQEVMEGARW